MVRKTLDYLIVFSLLVICFELCFIAFIAATGSADYTTLKFAAAGFLIITALPAFYWKIVTWILPYSPYDRPFTFNIFHRSQVYFYGALGIAFFLSLLVVMLSLLYFTFALYLDTSRLSNAAGFVFFYICVAALLFREYRKSSQKLI